MQLITEEKFKEEVMTLYAPDETDHRRKIHGRGYASLCQMHPITEEKFIEEVTTLHVGNNGSQNKNSKREWQLSFSSLAFIRRGFKLCFKNNVYNFL